ncbi:CooT family nickel-binding protein [Desulfosporosinus youngiae]|uniref:Putative RNA-binding protein n=1 Tax=Desulfosporosinus youngiae DSM 17734 TaxID=768710 RepID=H5XS52_9FIRM|nr:CooT family nickel-binding protein [Desulfosporosinus youngiae]EHQ87664.1 putative RNA-binding protein [Desulfosporosinus youngiae DSM 17734]
MCESNVYLKDGENEVMIMESVDTIVPCENGLNLMDIMGRQLFVPAKIKGMTLLNHRIILEKLT